MHFTPTNPTKEKTMTTIYLQAAIDHAKEREAELYKDEPRIFSGHASGWTDTPVGQISVAFVVAAGRTTNRPEHMRQAWELNGKRIARDKLITLLRNC
jgi:hypothetical protein